MIIEPATIDYIRQTLNLPDLHLAIELNNFKEFKDYRRHLRHSAAEYLDLFLEDGQIDPSEKKNQYREDFLILEDLSRIPQLKLGQISFSHCPSHGCFAFSRACKGLGVDIEVNDRVETKIIGRISTQEEMDIAPGPGYLWSAKEASYKSFLNFDQPKLASDVEIFDWSEKNKNYFAYRFKLNTSNNLGVFGQGLCYADSRLNLSLSKI